ncbi:MAG: racemase [Chloroflexi bacterium]|nr:racemase [Chloroflexota bacterium]
MRITDIQVHLISMPAGPAFRWRDGLPGSDPDGTGAVLRIVTDDGHDGLAFTSRGVIVQDLVERRIRKDLVGQDPLQKEWLWHRIWELDRIEEFPIYVLGLIDVALWDLTGKVADLPVYQLLGGFRTSIPAYASTVTFGSIQEYLDVADQCIELGYPAIKLHAWGDARRDAKLCLALREHVGDELPLMYDGSAGFDLPDAIYLGHALADAGYLWYEEPMREFSITAYKWLGAAVRVPLLVAETSDGAHMNTADFIASGCASFVRTSAGLKGGLTGGLRIAHLADSFRLRAEVHGDGLVNRHLCMAIPNTTYYESLVRTNPVVRAPEIDAQGLVHAPTGPGIGWEATWDRPPWEGGSAQDAS